MRLKYLVLWIFLCMAVPAHCHPLHLTFTNLEFKTQNNRWLLTIKVFTDDFSTNLKRSTGYESVPDNKQGNGEADKILKTWLDTRFRIWFDKVQIPVDTWKFDGIKVKEDASWITFVITAPMPVSEIRIRNTILMDLYSDQKNLFLLTLGRKQSAYEFKNKDKETTIELRK